MTDRLTYVIKFNMARFDADDYNGECFIRGEGGEHEEDYPECQYVFPDGRPDSWAEGTAIDPNNAEHREWLQLFAMANLTRLNQVQGTVAVKINAVITYIRCLAVRQGYVFQTQDPATHRCRYSLRVAEQGQRIRDDHALVLAFNALSGAEKKRYRDDFRNMVCTVAYFFRVRGHHWQQSFNDRYSAIWRKIKQSETENNPGIEWQYIARHCFKVIYPDTLDGYWAAWREDGTISNALRLRFTSAPAGLAGIYALRIGLRDLKQAVPALIEEIEKQETEINRIMTAINGSRWAGSINHNYYGAPRVEFEEAALGGAASYLVASLEAFAKTSRLKDSPALQRIATNAPLIGGIFKTLLEGIARDPEQIRALMVPRERVRAALAE